MDAQELSPSHASGHIEHARIVLELGCDALSSGPVCAWEPGACVWGRCGRAKLASAIATTRKRAHRARENSARLGRDALSGRPVCA